MDSLIGSALFTGSISYTLPSFWLGGIHFSNAPGKKSQYHHNTVCKNAWYYLFIFNKCGIVPFGRSLLLYNTWYKKTTRLPGVFNYLSNITYSLILLPSKNLYHISIVLGSILYYIWYMCNWAIIYIVRLMYNIWGAYKRYNKLCSSLALVFVYNNAYNY